MQVGRTQSRPFSHISVSQADLGHCARFFKRSNQSPKTANNGEESNPLEPFILNFYATAPLPELENTGALFSDPPGTADVFVLRSQRAKQALNDAEVVIHLTPGQRGVGQSEHDGPLLKPFWKVRKRFLDLPIGRLKIMIFAELYSGRRQCEQETPFVSQTRPPQRRG